ncbi:MAG TPA: hypothetical protein VMS99_04700 [Acidimicrobiia bacterium]|nr:hypothetical protein [Acidimicrobiia bacterium]
MSRRFLVLLAGVTLVVAACGDGAESDTTSTSTTIPPVTTTTTAPTTTTTSPSTTSTLGPTTTTDTVVDTNDLAEGSGCTPGRGSLPDGEWYGLVVSRSDDSLEFDLACWFTGDVAVLASAEDGEESPPPNDYYVRNANPETRDVPVAPDVEVVFYPDGDPTNEDTVSYDEWDALVAQRGYELGVWLEVEEGLITAIREQWVP